MFAVGILALGAFCWVIFSRPVAAQAKTLTWKIDPACKNYNPTPQRWCDFFQTQIHLGESNDACDQWNVTAEAPGVVTDVSCKTTGAGEFHFLQYKEANKPQVVPGQHYGNIGVCRGWINGGDANIEITVTYK